MAAAAAVGEVVNLFRASQLQASGLRKPIKWWKNSNFKSAALKILVPVKRVVDYNVKVRVKRRFRAWILPTSRCP